MVMGFGVGLSEEEEGEEEGGVYVKTAMGEDVKPQGVDMGGSKAKGVKGGEGREERPVPPIMAIGIGSMMGELLVGRLKGWVGVTGSGEGQGGKGGTGSRGRGRGGAGRSGAERGGRDSNEPE